MATSQADIKFRVLLKKMVLPTLMGNGLAFCQPTLDQHYQSEIPSVDYDQCHRYEIAT